MKSMKDDIDFRVRRVWVKGGDIPRVGDRAAAKEFVLRVKRGDFPEAPKKSWKSKNLFDGYVPVF